MKLSITSILISSASIAIVSAQDIDDAIAFGTNQTLSPTVAVTRPDTPFPTPGVDTPFPTEIPPVVSLF